MSLITVLKTILSHISVVTPTLLATFVWYVFYYPFTFSPFVSLNLKWVSYSQHIVGLWLVGLFFFNSFLQSMPIDSVLSSFTFNSTAGFHNFCGLEAIVFKIKCTIPKIPQNSLFSPTFIYFS